jgi:hypothetical protein
MALEWSFPNKKQKCKSNKTKKYQGTPVSSLVGQRRWRWTQEKTTLRDVSRSTFILLLPLIILLTGIQQAQAP